MSFRITPIIGLCALLALTGCGTRPDAAPTVRPADPAFVAQLPDGPITPPAEPAQAAAALATARAVTDPAQQFEAWRQAALLGSPEGHFHMATMLTQGAGGPALVGRGFDTILALARKGYGPAAMTMWQLATASRSANLHQHAPYWLNIARRAGDAAANDIYNKMLAEDRAAGRLPAGTGNGDYFDSALRMTAPIRSGAALEDKVAAQLLPGWVQRARMPVAKEGRKYDVLELENVEGQRLKLYFDTTDWGQADRSAD